MVLAYDRVTAAVQAALDQPMTIPECQERGGVGPFGGEAGHGIGDVAARPLGLLTGPLGRQARTGPGQPRWVTGSRLTAIASSRVALGAETAALGRRRRVGLRVRSIRQVSMLALRSLAFNLCFYAATTVLAVGGLPALVSRRAVLHLARTWARVTLWLLRVVAGTRVEFRGLEAIPPGPVLVAAKHQSALETLALCTVFPEFAYVLKRELLFIPLIGWYLSRGGMVAIDRTKGGRAMSLMNTAATESIRDGRQLIIFPEGTRRRPGDQPAYKQGLSHLYAALDVPCLPVALNTGLFWARNSFLRRPGTAVIAFLEPIPPGLPRQDFQLLAQARIEAASSTLTDGGPGRVAADGRRRSAVDVQASSHRS